MLTACTPSRRASLVPAAFRAVAILSLLLSATVVAVPAHAATVINEAQWVKGTVGFDQYTYGTYPYNYTYMLKLARVDYRTPSG